MTYSKILNKTIWKPNRGWISIKTIDMHTGGEPLRVVIDGFPEIKGNTVLERRNYVKEHYDQLRTALMHEPRGHADMYGCLLIPPNDQDGDFGVLFIHNEGYSTMCGHAIIALGTLAIEMGWVDAVSPITTLNIDAPCGRIKTFVGVKDGKVENVSFHCVPSFVAALGETVEIEGIGHVEYDLAYGGAFYAFVNSDKIGIPLIPKNCSRLIQAGMAIKHAVMNSSEKIIHPFEEDLSFLYGTIFIGGPVSNGVDSRNVCIFADGEVDRSPTGSGVSGRMALHHARNELAIGDVRTIESITGSSFKGSVAKTLSYGPHQAVIPRVEGQAYITGIHEFVIDPSDPFKNGFFLR